MAAQRSAGLGLRPGGCDGSAGVLPIKKTRSGGLWDAPERKGQYPERTAPGEGGEGTGGGSPVPHPSRQSQRTAAPPAFRRFHSGWASRSAPHRRRPGPPRARQPASGATGSRCVGGRAVERSGDAGDAAMGEPTLPAHAEPCGHTWPTATPLLAPTRRSPPPAASLASETRHRRCPPSPSWLGAGRGTGHRSVVPGASREAAVSLPCPPR
jgi:hypothetical protein